MKAWILALLLLTAPATGQEPSSPNETAQRSVPAQTEPEGIRKEAGAAVEELKPAEQPPTQELEIDCGMESGVSKATHAVEHISRRQRGRVYDIVQTRF